ncbi:MAG: DegT/DnrJ/EryC1/StrS family aminotransferase, partial [Eubacterium sp.]
YPKPMHKQTAFRDVPFVDESCDVTEKICKQVLALPMHAYMKEKEIKNICKVLKKEILLQDK